MNQDELVKGLKQLKKVFDKHHITFWLDFGTLLGAVREGKIIPWDNDVDISLWFDDVIKVLDTQEDLQQLGYELYITQGHYGLRDMVTKEHAVCVFFTKRKSGYLAKLHFCRGFKHLIWILSEPDYNTLDYDNFDYDGQFIPFIFKKTLVDICCKIQPLKRRKMIRLIWKLNMRFNIYFIERIQSPAECIEEFAMINFCDESFRIPKKYDKYLTFMYGNWRVPDKNGVALDKQLKDVEVIK